MITFCGASVTLSEGIRSGLSILSEYLPQRKNDVIAILINGMPSDLTSIVHDGDIVDVIEKHQQAGLDIIRHDTAHILAEAVKILYEDAKIAIGPVISDGFYYDIDLPFSISIDDLHKIEQEMHRIIKKNQPFIRECSTVDHAISIFQHLKEDYKVEIIKNIQGELSLYRHGEFVDLCRGPHGNNTSHLGHFKLLSVSGAYWRGDSKNKMLQRIYGTAWDTAEKLNEYLTLIDEQKKRDHRKIGKEMELFHLCEESPGMVFWHHDGWKIFQVLLQYMRSMNTSHGYEEISTPELLSSVIWQKSGHWDKFRQNMFIANGVDDELSYAVKPMSCPGCIEVFKHKFEGVVSYRELPKRVAEFGKVHRFESHGSLLGLMRTRAFTQDDAHIFCTNDNILDEAIAVCKFALQVYRDCGFHTDDLQFKLSDRPNLRVGSDESWDVAEKSLSQALDNMGVEYSINKGEGAFYGPKIEFVLKDCMKREWQLGTLQVDLNLGMRLGAVYVDSNGERKHPIILHRAIFGSFERFIGILLEHYAGKLPLWMAPVHVSVICVSEKFSHTAKEVANQLIDGGIRIILDVSDETVGYKIRRSMLRKVPYVVVIGEKEMQSGLIGLENPYTKEKEMMLVEECKKRLCDLIAHNVKK
ncbi:Threonine--tRNA ligase [Candidatus Fokinia solitaria]|uniref:Threonine--tRNA ligase n=1 Tax=Candidatus Fokinia solitaria TaxID=1802984 RepID=A0A2U8BSV9_9RICK|nr:threonine--tRNA ligase [Candidatus Fokinia solitaria]AWD33360.1 Threonine--tRNA ligase [Candidatus Fokinia solitaria]